MDTVADAAVKAADAIPRVPLADFQRDAAGHVSRLTQTGEPAILTVDGRPELVVQSAAAYQALLDDLDLARSTEAIGRSLDDVRAGRVRPAEEVFQELAAQFGIDMAK